MLPFGFYILKVILCSGILFAYYFLALRNKMFHRWNRFYLLASVFISLLLPLTRIHILQDTSGQDGSIIKVLQTISAGDEIIIDYGKTHGFQWQPEYLSAGFYAFISFMLAIIFMISIRKIILLRRKNPVQKLQEIDFILTTAPGTPFSFFNWIFWNNAIDLNSTHGQKIFNHEIAHVKEKHSLDKIFMNGVLIMFWLNPFFWLIQKELAMIHEFIADKESLEDNDISAFAEMILETIYPARNLILTNNLFHSPLKRRILMFTKNKNPKVSYLSRLLVLPLAAFIFFAFSLKTKTSNTPVYNSDRVLRVVVDAGHGGDDHGAVENNIREKDIVLAIAKKVKELNSNPNIAILLTRDADVTVPLPERIEFAKKNKADFFVSIHVDAEQGKNTNRGVVVIVPKNDNSYLRQSKSLGSALIESFRRNEVLPVTSNLTQRELGIWVLKANEYPSVLIETGFLSTDKDRQILSDEENRTLIAKNILEGIEKYALVYDQSAAYQNNPDTIPSQFIKDKKVESIIMSDNDDKATIVYKDGHKEIITKAELNQRDILLPPPPPPSPVAPPPPPNGATPVAPPTPPTAPAPPSWPNDAVYMLDGKKVSKKQIDALAPETIESIHVQKGKHPNAPGNSDNSKSVIKIQTKSAPTSDTERKDVSNQIRSNDTTPGKIFTKVEIEPEFPGGRQAWVKYISGKVQQISDSLTEKDFGTCVVKFIVGIDGSVRNIEATTMKETILAKLSVDAIKNGPNWIPAKQNGLVVEAYRLQPVTLTNPDSN